MNDQIQIERIETEFVNLQNEANEADLKTIAFQGQTIKEGSVLFSFKYSAFVRVIALTECFGPDPCVVFDYGRAEFAKALTNENFCTVPTDDQVNKNLREYNHARNTRNYHQIVSAFSGKLVKSPAFENKLISGEPSSVVQFLSKQDLKNVFVQTRFVGGSGSMDTEIPVTTFLNVFFRNRRKAFDFEESNDFDIRESLRLVWNQEYNCQLILIDGIRQHPQGLNFSEWLIQNKNF